MARYNLFVLEVPYQPTNLSTSCSVAMTMSQHWRRKCQRVDCDQRSCALQGLGPDFRKIL